MNRCALLFTAFALDACVDTEPRRLSFAEAGDAVRIHATLHTSRSETAVEVVPSLDDDTRCLVFEDGISGTLDGLPPIAVTFATEQHDDGPCTVPTLQFALAANRIPGDSQLVLADRSRELHEQFAPWLAPQQVLFWAPFRATFYPGDHLIVEWLPLPDPTQGSFWLRIVGPNATTDLGGITIEDGRLAGDIAPDFTDFGNRAIKVGWHNTSPVALVGDVPGELDVTYEQSLSAAIAPAP